MTEAVPFGYYPDPIPEPERLPWEDGEMGDFIISPWFGAFEIGADGWINHSELIWLYMGDVEDESNIWMFSLFLNAWVWSQEGTFPMIYDSSSGSWTYYFQVPDLGVWVYDMTIGEWIFYPMG